MKNFNLKTYPRNSFLIYTKTHRLDNICKFRDNISVSDCNYFSFMISRKYLFFRRNGFCMTFAKPNLCPLRSHWFEDPMYCKKWSSNIPLMESFQPGLHNLQYDLISKHQLKIWIQSGEPWLRRHRCEQNDIIEDWLKGERRTHFPVAILKFLRNFTSNSTHISKTWTCEIIVLEKFSCFI